MKNIDIKMIVSIAIGLVIGSMALDFIREKMAESDAEETAGFLGTRTNR